MISKDNELIKKLKTRISILIIIIFSLLYWLRINYLDVGYNRDQVESLTYELIEKDILIRNLEYKIKSIENKKIEKTKKEFIINTKKEKEKIKKDTISIKQIATDSISTQPDTSIKIIY